MKIIDEILRDDKFTDTRIGSKNSYEFSNGNCLPLLGIPHGMTYYTLETSKDRGTFFFDPEEDSLKAIRLTHQASPWIGDFSYLSILPFNDNLDVKYDRYKSIFRPNFYEIIFDKTRIRMSADRNDGIMEIDSDKDINIFLTSKNFKIEKREGNLLIGYVNNYTSSMDKDFKMYIAINLSSDFSLEDIEDDSYILHTKSSKLVIKISSSFINYDNLYYNYSLMEDNLEDLLIKTTNIWKRYFSTFDIKIKERNSFGEKFEKYDRKDQYKFFFHCLYRALLFPMSLYEKNKYGEEVHYDTYSRSIKKGKLYTNIGFWDGQKTLFPLYGLFFKKDFSDILEGILNSYRDSGYLPKWLGPDERGMMPGTLVDNVIAEANSKGIRKDLMEDFLKAMIDTAEKPSKDNMFGRFRSKEYREFGYIPSDYRESVNETLDNCLSDYSIYLLAKDLGYDDIASKYYEYSKNYKNLFDKDSKLMRAKDRKGNFLKDFDPYEWGGAYTEGSSFQNSYNIYHDFRGLVELFDSKKDFKAALDRIANSKSIFRVGSYKQIIHEMREMEEANFGQIAISNQPSFHLPFLYYYADSIHSTQFLLKELLLNYFSYSFRGYPGDEDNGSMSSWYIFSSMGIYPICPGKNEYILSIGLFDEMTINFEDGHSLKIKVDENYQEKKFVDKIYIDGELFEDRMITYDKFNNINELVFNLKLLV